MRLHILTAVSRPENLPTLASSLAKAAQAASVDIAWHWRFDLKRENVGGQTFKNAMLDEIVDGWVWILDDDTFAHSDLFTALVKALDHQPDVHALVVGQRRSDGRYLSARLENVQVGLIDIGQAVLRRDLIGDKRIPLEYEGDGLFLASVLVEGTEIVFLDTELSYHNALEPV